VPSARPDRVVATIGAMDGTPKLITDVKFTERRRGGYEPDEVDNFLEQIADKVAKLQDMLRRATAQTEQAEARATEAQRAQSAAESRADRLEAALAEQREAGEKRAADPEVEAEQASKMLLMAQRTADATIEDANRTAQQTVAEARSKATHLVIEAEAEAARLRTDAERETQELIAERREAVLAEVRDLEELRETVSRDVDVLHRYVDEQRARLRSGVDELQRLLDDPAAFRESATPTTSGATAEAVVMVDHTVAAEPAGAPVGEPVPETDLSAGDEPQQPPSTETAGSQEPEADLGDMAAAPVDEPEFPEVEVPELLRQRRPEQASTPPSEIDLTAAELFHDESDQRSPGADEGGPASPPTELFSPFADREGGEDPLGTPDAEADAAMRAFFEASFEEGDEAHDKQKSRFGFRR
jgi:cell division initiation protein